MNNQASQHHTVGPDSRLTALPVVAARMIFGAAIAMGLAIPTRGEAIAPANVATGTQHAAATVHPHATDAAMWAFESGGNAVDAAVAAALMLGVVDGHNSGLGGGCFVLIHTADGKIFAIDGRETAPALAKRDMYVVDGKADPSLSQTGPLAVAVPGALAAYRDTMRMAGSLQLATLLADAAKRADDGFTIDRVYAAKLQAKRQQLANFPGSKAMFFAADGEPYQAGDVLRLPDLADTYQNIARDPDWFYNGGLAKRISDWMIAHGGVLRESDFANYQAKQRSPIRSTYRGYEVVGFPPPSSGGVHTAQILNILEQFDLAGLMRNAPVQANHVIAESFKIAFADRAHWLGDSDFAAVPTGLIDKTYAQRLASQIKLESTLQVDSHGLPEGWDTNIFGNQTVIPNKHTTHIATADTDGNWVAITATVNTTFGSKIVVPGTGLILNNEMDDFSAQPGMPNAFGLVGADANAVAPGKRPLSSMTPTIVMKDGQPVMTVGAAGGPKIITQVIWSLIQAIDGGQIIEACVAAPRLHHQWRPDTLFVEDTFDQAVVAGLRRLGHPLEYLSSAGITQAIARSPDGMLRAVSDPRVPGKAAAR